MVLIPQLNYILSIHFCKFLCLLQVFLLQPMIINPSRIALYPYLCFIILFHDMDMDRGTWSSE